MRMLYSGAGTMAVDHPWPMVHGTTGEHGSARGNGFGRCAMLVAKRNGGQYWKVLILDMDDRPKRHGFPETSPWRRQKQVSFHPCSIVLYFRRAFAFLCL